MRKIHQHICSTIVIALAAWWCAGCASRDARTQLTAAESALEQGRFEETLGAAEGYLKQNPRGPGAAEAHYFRGRALEQRVKRDEAQFMRDLAAARADYLEALQHNPSRDLEAYIQTSLGNVTFWLHDYQTAAAAFQRAYEMLPPGELKGWALYRLGLSQQRRGDWAAADQTFAAVENQFPATEIAARAREHRGARAFYVQVASFQNIGNAENLVATLRGRGFSAQRLLKPERNLHVVMAGPARNYAEAMGLRGRLSGEFKDAMIVP